MAEYYTRELPTYIAICLIFIVFLTMNDSTHSINADTTEILTG